ncbi:metallophosphoesterase [Maledivibacter halophilus]|uniref:Predicted phosphohydrolases n=1 Tax=Maledivibacter halophilus TaxID=36842 RepID=A0A1T5KNE1_9FIRM|nr:metallophosphoesterase [Maledivibacter halophilus]SKC65183.1 Predicted phosphohydrolases [Maledivibacter halophilus]
MKKIKNILFSLLGRVYIPRDILESGEDILLHISDTPASFYSSLELLIKELKPKYIVHTGDLVDNIKLELYPRRRNMYRKKVKDLIKILENSFAHKIYLTIGNHDDSSIVTEYINRSIIVEGSDIMVIDEENYKISHFYSEISKSPEKYNLFGHDLSMTSDTENDIVYLNGIIGINIITLRSKKIFVLPYPYGTDDARMCKSNIGL